MNVDPQLPGSACPEELGRSPFHKDHDRIIFSGAFRRLGRKTQVHPVTSNDHIHTRLTHSLEVSCVGRSLGMRVGETIRSALPDWCDPSDLGMVVQSASTQLLAKHHLARGISAMRLKDVRTRLPTQRASEIEQLLPHR